MQSTGALFFLTDSRSGSINLTRPVEHLDDRVSHKAGHVKNTDKHLTQKETLNVPPGDRSQDGSVASHLICIKTNSHLGSWHCYTGLPDYSVFAEILPFYYIFILRKNLYDFIN